MVTLIKRVKMTWRVPVYCYSADDISFECGFGLFNCTLSGRCININQVCDGTSDCGSDEDEQDCREYFAIVIV